MNELENARASIAGYFNNTTQSPIAPSYGEIIAKEEHERLLEEPVSLPVEEPKENLPAVAKRRGVKNG